MDLGRAHSRFLMYVLKLSQPTRSIPAITWKSREKQVMWADIGAQGLTLHCLGQEVPVPRGVCGREGRCEPVSLTIRVQAAPCRLCLVEITFCCREQQRLASRSVSRSLEVQRTGNRVCTAVLCMGATYQGRPAAAGGHLKGGTWHKVDNAGFSSGPPGDFCPLLSQVFSALL